MTEYIFFEGIYWAGLIISLGIQSGEIVRSESKLELLRAIFIALVKSFFWPVGLLTEVLVEFYHFWTNLPDE